MLQKLPHGALAKKKDEPNASMCFEDWASRDTIWL
jgi:hypothetical protein